MPKLDPHPMVGFLADGREVVFAGTGPSAARWSSALLVAEGGSLASLSPIFENARTVAITPHGDRAAVLRKDRAQIVALPSGRPIAELPSPAADADDIALAISNDGSSVALSASGKVSIFTVDVNTSTARLEHEEPIDGRAMRFSPDGQTLFVDAFGTMTAMRRGASSRTHAKPEYVPKLPAGFQAARHDRTTFKLEDGERGEPGLFAWYRSKNGASQVLAYAYDASELDGRRDLDAWARSIATRFGATAAIGTSRWRVWEDEKQRSVAMMLQVRDGCDPHDAWVRFTERNGVLYRVRVEVAPGTPTRRVASLERAFLLEPFGVSTPSLGFKIPRAKWLPGPC